MMLDILNNLGAVITLGMGGLGLFFPTSAATFVGLEAQSKAGQSEFRATYGGLFVMLGGVAILWQKPEIFMYVGLCWLGAAIGRVLSIFVDKLHSTKNWQGVAFEAAIAGFLLIGSPISTFVETLF